MYLDVPTHIAGGAIENNICTESSDCMVSAGLYASKPLTITASPTYTYSDNFLLHSDLATVGTLTVTAGIATLL